MKRQEPGCAKQEATCFLHEFSSSTALWFWGPAAFHCQQAAEKTLKAFLISRSVPFERVHSLVYLVDLCKVQDPAFASLRETTESLAPYAVEIRYPGDAPDISLDEARKAVADAEEVWMFVLARLPSALQSEIPGEEQ